jgi:hypothetical protein
MIETDIATEKLEEDDLKDDGGAGGATVCLRLNKKPSHAWEQCFLASVAASPNVMVTASPPRIAASQSGRTAIAFLVRRGTAKAMVAAVVETVGQGNTRATAENDEDAKRQRAIAAGNERHRAQFEEIKRELLGK